MNVLRMCLDPRVLAGLAGVGVALFLIAPDLAFAALPFLIVAACPLSMAAMALNMQGMPEHGAGRMAGSLAPVEDTSAMRRRLARLEAERAALVTRLAERAREDEFASEPPNKGGTPQPR